MVTFAYDNRMQLMVVKKFAPQNGIEKYAPACVERVLSRTIFENLATGHRRFVVPMLDVVRLMILTNYELTDSENNKLLEEMQQEFRYAVFEHKTLEVMPESVQWLLRGNRYKESVEDDSSVMQTTSADSRTAETSEAQAGQNMISKASRETLPVDTDGTLSTSTVMEPVPEPVPENSLEDSPQRGRMDRADSVQNHLDIVVKEMKLRQEEMKSFGLVPALVAEKASEMSVKGTLRFMIRWSLHRVGCEDVSKTWERIEETITTEPKRWILYIPWKVARTTLKVGGSVIGWNPSELPGTLPRPQLERTASAPARTEEPAAMAEKLRKTVSSPPTSKVLLEGGGGQNPCNSESASTAANEDVISWSMSSIE
jgi:hypothetical protein